MVERFTKKENPFLIYGHNQTRAFNFIDDAVNGTVLAMNKGINGEIYHIGDDEEISIEELVRFVGNLLNLVGSIGRHLFQGQFQGDAQISKSKKGS